MRVGVDEAGKGPVLGPMVAAAVRADPAALPDGVDDSKRLPPARREAIAGRLRAAPAVTVGVATVHVERIDDPATDMNSLTVAAHGEAIAAVAIGGDEVIADAADVDADRFAGRLREAVADEAGNAGDAGNAGGAKEGTDPGVDVRVRAEHRADESDPSVAAASVVAKVERDAAVAALADEFGDVGSGYPSDPTTRRFLREWVREHGDLPDCARRSWSTCDDLLAAAEQSSLSEF
jgi:ribonuclease HII